MPLCSYCVYFLFLISFFAVVDAVVHDFVVVCLFFVLDFLKPSCSQRRGSGGDSGVCVCVWVCVCVCVCGGG